MVAKRRQFSGRNIELAKIHMAAGALGLIRPGDDTAYRDMLWSVGRVRSSKDLDTGGRQRVLAHLVGCGWQDTSSPQRRMSGTAQTAYIRFLWDGLKNAGQLKDSSEHALRAFVVHQSAPYHPQKAGYSAPELMPPRVAQRVIEHLKHWCKRTGVATE